MERHIHSMGSTYSRAAGIIYNCIDHRVMVTTFGNNIVGAFTGGQSVEAIYTGSVKVWPSEPVPSGSYYIKWWPKDLSGSFTIGGEARWLQDYNGYYSGPFFSSSWGASGSGYWLDDNAFRSTGVVAVETNLDVLGWGAFLDCSSLVYISASNCKYLGRNNNRYTHTFNGCTSLRNVYFSNLSYIGPYTFFSCSSLSDVYLPECLLTVEEGFMNCGIQSVYLPNCSIIDNNTFEACSNLREVYLPVCNSIGASAFWRCGNLETMVLGYSGVCSGLGLTSYQSIISIYVPLEWVSEYKSQYSGRASMIFPIPHE